MIRGVLLFVPRVLCVVSCLAVIGVAWVILPAFRERSGEP